MTTAKLQNRIVVQSWYKKLCWIKILREHFEMTRYDYRETTKSNRCPRSMQKALLNGNINRKFWADNVQLLRNCQTELWIKIDAKNSSESKSWEKISGWRGTTTTKLKHQIFVQDIEDLCSYELFFKYTNAIFRHCLKNCRQLRTDYPLLLSILFLF